MGYLAIWDYLCSVNRRDGYLLRVLQNSKITYRPHCPGTGGGALLTPQVSILRHDGKLWRFFLHACLFGVNFAVL